MDPWKWRITIGATMLIGAFLGVVITHISRDIAWHYWRILTLFYAIVGLAFSHFHRPSTLFKEILHWIGLLLSITLISYLVKTGLLSRFEASLQILNLLALGTYLAGLYIDLTLLPIGLLLGLSSALIAFFDEHLYIILIPLVLITLIITFFLSKNKNRPLA